MVAVQIDFFEENTQEEEGEYVSMQDEDGNWESYWVPANTYLTDL